MKFTVLKIGGNVLNNPAQLQTALDYFAALPAGVLIHGGGKKASEVLRQLGIAPKLIDGRRLTDKPTLEVVTMVYAGLLNKSVVAQLQARNCNAIGFSGADGDMVRAHQRPSGDIDYGFAGDLDQVNATLLNQLLQENYRPVLCPITHDGKGQLLNTNADTIAQAAAQALVPYGEVSLQYCFELPGVLRDINDPESVIAKMTPASFAEYKTSGIVSGGMLPKLDNAFAAIAAGVKEVVIGDIAALSANAGTHLSDNA